jgi:hypothetical protein
MGLPNTRNNKMWRNMKKKKKRKGGKTFPLDHKNQLRVSMHILRPGSPCFECRYFKTECNATFLMQKSDFYWLWSGGLERNIWIGTSGSGHLDQKVWIGRSGSEGLDQVSASSHQKSRTHIVQLLSTPSSKAGFNVGKGFANCSQETRAYDRELPTTPKLQRHE